MTSLFLRGGRILDRTSERLAPADVLVEDDRIAAIGPAVPLPPDARVLDLSQCLLIPGLVNAHTHAHNHLLRGLGDDWTLEDLSIRRAALYDNRTPEDQYLSAAIGAIEMLRTGCTAAFDLFTTSSTTADEAASAVVQAYTDVGLRAVLAPSVSDIAFPHTVPGFLDMLPPELRARVATRAPVSPDLLAKTSEEAIRHWDGTAGGRIRIALAPTIPGQCTDGLLSEFARLSSEYGAPLHTHLAESKVQAVNAQRRWGKSMVSRLLELGVVGPRFVGAHGVWLTDEDMAHLAQHGASLVHNPASNLKTGSGIAPVREMLDAGVNVALATDGCMASDNQNMFEAMRFAGLLARVRSPHQSQRWLSSRDVWRMATGGSARALGLQDTAGALEVGRKADVAALRLDSPFLTPLNHALNALVFAETAADVDTVLVDGRIVLERGRVLTVDESALRQRAQQAADRVRAANVDASLEADRLAPYLARACQAVAHSPFPINRYAVPVGSPSA